MTKLTTWFPTFLIAAALVLSAVGCSKEAKKRRYLARADQDFQAERYDRAEVEYLAVLTIPPASPEALGQLGRLYWVQGKVQQARVMLQKALDFESGNRQLRSLLGTTCLTMGQFAEAHEVALRLLEKEPQDPEALLLLAQSSLTTNQANQVQQSLDRVPSPIRDNCAFHLAQGTVFVMQNSMDKAENEFKAAIASDSKSSRAYLLLANLYLIRNQPRQADEALRSASMLAPLRSLERLRYADWQMRNGAAESARQMVEEITRKASDYAPAWVFLARMAFAQQKTQECATLLKTALARDPFNLEALLLKGTLLLGAGDPTNAIAHFERVGQIYPGAPQVQYGLALAQFQYGEIGKALASVNRSLAIDPNFSDALVFLANISLRQGDTTTTIAVSKHLQKDQPSMKQAYLLLAGAYVVERSLDNAVSVYRQMGERFPDDPQPPLLRGMVLIQQRKLNEARQAIEQSLHLSPNSLGAVEQLVELDLLEKQYAAATQQVEEQIARNPAAAEPYLLMAKIHVVQALKAGVGDTTNRVSAIPAKLELENTPEAQEQVDKAQAALRKAIALNKDLRNGYLLLAQLLVAAHQQEAALKGLLSFSSGTNDVAALMQIGMIYEQLNNAPAARDAYEKALKLEPRFGLALNNLACLYSEKLNEPDKAYAMAAKARDLMPYDPFVADTLGWILYGQGKYSRALGLIEESAMRLTDEPEIQYHLGMALYMMGEEESARLALERAVREARDAQISQTAAQPLSVLAISVDTAGPGEVARLEQALANKPDDPVALVRLAGIQSREGNYQKALSSYETALKTAPHNPRLKLKLAELWFEHLNDRSKAMDLAKEAHDLSPQDASISRLLGRLLCEKGDYRDYNWALSLLVEADRKLPENLAATYDLAWAYYNLGNIEAAEKKMQAVAAAPADPRQAEADLFLTMLAALREPNNPQAGSARVQTVLREHPDYIPALMVSARLLEERLDYQEAAGIYEGILRRNPLFVPATCSLALLYCEHLKNETKAYELVVKARESRPDDVQLASALAILCYKRAEYRRTVQLLESVSAGASQKAERLYYLGMAHYQLKDIVESKAALRRALDLNLEAQLASEANRALNSMN